MPVSLKVEEFEIGNGSRFYIRKYDPFLSLSILGEVQKKFLAPVASLINAIQDNELSVEDKVNMVTVGLEKVSANLDGPSLVALAKTVLNGEYISVSVMNEDLLEPVRRLDEGTLNRAVSSVADVIELVVKVLRVNYEEVFTRGATLIGSVRDNTAIA